MQFIRGDTFFFAGPVIVEVNGTEESDFTGWQASSQIRTTSNTLIATLSVSWVSRVPGVISVTFDGSTAAWPVGPARMDLQFVTATGKIVSTKAAPLMILEDVTIP